MRTGRNPLHLTVPVSLDRLGVEGRHDAILLAQQMQQVSGYVDLVAYLQGSDRPNLEFPLPRHDLCIDARDDDASLQKIQGHSYLCRSWKPF